MTKRRRRVLVAALIVAAGIGGTWLLIDGWAQGRNSADPEPQADSLQQPQTPSQTPPSTAEEAVGQLKQLGAVFQYDRKQIVGVTFSWRYITQEQIALIVLLPTIRQIDFNVSPNVTDETLALLAKLPALEELNLGGTPISNSGLSSLLKLKHLKKLYLWRTKLSDEGMKTLARMPALEHLNLWDTPISDVGLMHLANLRTLKRLGIGQSIQTGEEQGRQAEVPAAALSQSAVARFRERLPKCKVFYWDRGKEGDAASPDVELLARQSAQAAKGEKKTVNKAVQLPPSLWTRKKGSDWPGFLGPTADGKSPETGLSNFNKASPPQLVWYRDLGEGYGACAISRGRLFLMERRNDKLRVVCLNAETGKELWANESPTTYEDQLGYGNGPRCSPVVDGDRVYAFGADGKLLCLNVASGKRVWSVDTTERFGVVQYFFGVGSTPMVEGDLLIVAVGGSPPEQRKGGRYNLEKLTGNGTGIVAFDKFSGEVRYAITNTLAGYAGPRAAQIDGRRWCFMFARQGLVGFQPAKGDVKFVFPWRARFRAGVNAATPVIVGNEVFITEAYGPGAALLRINNGKYDVVWKDSAKSRRKSLASHWSTPIFHQGFLYGCSGRHTNEATFRCLEWKTGKVVWSQRMDALFSLLMVDGRFLLLDEYGQFQITAVSSLGYLPSFKMDLSEQQVAGRPLLAFPAWSAPVLSHGLLYLRGKDRLVCLDLIPSGGRGP